MYHHLSSATAVSSRCIILLLLCVSVNFKFDTASISSTEYLIHHATKGWQFTAVEYDCCKRPGVCGGMHDALRNGKQRNVVLSMSFALLRALLVRYPKHPGEVSLIERALELTYWWLLRWSSPGWQWTISQP